MIVDCAALQPSTVESALFGHERGSFTGAVYRRIGYLESADGGTVFLDEISRLPLDIQGRLLTVFTGGDDYAVRFFSADSSPRPDSGGE